MKFVKEKLIILLIMFLPVLFIIIISFLLTSFISTEHYKNLKADKIEIKEKFINNNKNIIKANIESTSNYINDKLSLSNNELKKNIKLHVYNGYNIMTSIYNAYKDTKTEEEIKDLIKHSLKDIRFNNKRGYLFLYDLSGTSVLHPLKPSREGKNFFDAKDINGTYIVRESIDIVKSKVKEGFQNWYFHKKQNDDKEYEKIGFVKFFKAYNWFIGTGEYVEDFKAITKNKILDHISILKYIDNASIFVIDYEGNVLVNKNNRNPTSEIFKTKRIKIYKKFINSKDKNIFTQYSVKDTNNNEYTKYSYLQKIDSFNFVISLGFNIDTSNVIIKERTEQLEEKFNDTLKTLLLSSLISTSILLFISYFISKYVEKLFNNYKDTLNRKNMMLTKAQSQAKIGSWEQTSNNNTLIWSNEVYRIFEIDIKDNLTFEKFLNLIHPEDKSSLISTFQNSVNEHREYYFEHRVVLHNGRIKYVIERGSHVYDENNKYISTLGTVQDITSRKDAEILLQESEEQYKSLMEQAPYGIEIFDENGLQIGVNKAHQKLWGFDTSKTLMKFNILNDEKFRVSGLLPFIKRAYLGEIIEIPPHKFDPMISTTFTDGVGGSRLIKTQIYPVKDINNRVKNIIVTQMDVTSEEELAKRDRMLNSVFQVVPDLLFIMKNDGEIIDYRAQENSDLYVDPKVYLGKMMVDILPSNIESIFTKIFKDLLVDEELKIFKYERKLSGELRHFEARMAKLPLDEYVMAIVRDITEQVFDEQRLIFQSLLLKQSLSATDVVDKNGLFTYVNDAYVKMWGYNTKDEIIGTSPLSHCVDESTPQTIIDKVEEDGEFILQFKAKKKDGSEFDALMAVKSVYYLDEKLYIASTMDISEKEKMREDNLNQEKILYQQSKMAAMGEMLENIAHQWRQPLSTISTLATGSKLQKEMNCLSDSELDMAFDTINNSAQYLSETIEDFRSFFDPSNNKISEFLLSNTIEKTLSILESQFKINDIKIIRNIEDITVFSIENELIQVLVNLLNNSRDALLNLKEEKRYIFIDIYEDKEDFIIEIKDNAKGIAIDIIDRIFEPYFTTKHKAQGTGIGLYMSEEIIKTHLNGTLLVNNETYEYDGNICVGVKFSIRIKIKA